MPANSTSRPQEFITHTTVKGTSPAWVFSKASVCLVGCWPSSLMFSAVLLSSFTSSLSVFCSVLLSSFTSSLSVFCYVLLSSFASRLSVFCSVLLSSFTSSPFSTLCCCLPLPQVCFLLCAAVFLHLKSVCFLLCAAVFLHLKSVRFLLCAAISSFTLSLSVFCYLLLSSFASSLFVFCSSRLSTGYSQYACVHACALASLSGQDFVLYKHLNYHRVSPHQLAKAANMGSTPAWVKVREFVTSSYIMLCRLASVSHSCT